MLTEGMKAPEFVLPDKDGRQVRLSDFAEKEVVVYFYPKDNTSGCSKQAQGFAELYQQIKDVGVEVIGISKDSQASHQKFAEKYNLPFLLLSDVERKAIEDYDVWQKKMMYGKPVMGVVRTTYFINKEGIVEKAWPKANASENPAQVLEYLRTRGQ